ncbi:MAG: hypothetical protein LUB59_07490, partial [Candidatus Gastranaerophilales bacterium]|nr:hypothetical protein [Candidatus Gastranaerophilales bacterium]
MSYDNLYIPNGIQLVNGLPVYVSENKYWSAYPLPYGNIGQLTDAYFSDNTGDGDGGLRNLEENISIANKLDYLQYQNSLYYNFNIDTTFLNGSSGATNPFGSGSSTTIEPIVIGGTGSIGGSKGVGGTESVSGIVGTGGTGGVGGAGSIGGTSSEDDLTMPDADNYSAQFTARLSLIEKYCKKWGKTVDVDKIKKEYADDPQAGVEYCDDILN